MYPVLRSFLFQLDAERAHYLTLNTLKTAYHLGLTGLAQPEQGRVVKWMGLDLPNPVGLAAGLDKNGEYIDALASLGFGYIEIGTVTPRPQEGNPKPRLFRVAEHRAVINRMGFNNKGIDYLIQQKSKSQFKGIVGINIGKNAQTPIENAVDDYLICLEKAYPHASYISINISSPNTQNLRSLQHSDELTKLLQTLKNRQAQLASEHGHYVPLAVKIAPDLDEAQIRSMAQTFKQSEIDGIIATNTTIDKSSLGTHPLATEQGGLSGRPVRDKSQAVLRQLYAELGACIPLVGVGGILNGQDAQEKITAGAVAVQLYSGLVYRGPELVGECIRALQAIS